LSLALILAVLILIVVVAPVHAGTTGIISGTIIDSATNQKLEGVNIVVEGSNLTAVSDKNGFFAIVNVSPGDYKVTASLVGYSDARVEKVSVLMDVTATVNFTMTQGVVQEEQVIAEKAPVTTVQTATPTMYVVDSHTETEITPQAAGLLYTAPAIVATQPGVVTEPGGLPHIRGGRAEEIGWTIDGIPVQDPVSNGFGTNLVTVGMDKMEIYTGGYRPEYGNANSGILNEVIKTGRTAPGNTIEYLGGGQAFMGIYPQIGGYSGKNWDYYTAGYLWRSNLNDPTFDHVNSSDLVGKFNYSLNKKDKLTLLALQGSEKYEMPSFHTDSFSDGSLVTVPSTQDQQHQTYLLTALTLSHNINSNSFYTIRPYYFQTTQNLDGIGMNGGTGWWSASSSKTTGLLTDYTNQTSSKNTMKMGAMVMSSTNRYQAIVPYLNDLYNSYGADPPLNDYEYTANADTQQMGVYVQDQLKMGNRWAAEMGLRYDNMRYKKVANPSNSDSQTSPRLGLSYVLNPKDKFKFTWGRTIQFPRSQAAERVYTDPNWIDVIGLSNADLKPTRCSQFDLGWDHQFKGSLSMQVTPFYRKYTDMLQTEIIDPDNPWGASTFANLGEGSSKGVEFLLKKQETKHWSGWLAYTYMIAKAQSSDDRLGVTPGVTSYVDWDQRHTVELVAKYNAKTWDYSISGEYGSGLPIGPDNTTRIPSHTVFGVNMSRDVNYEGATYGRLVLSVANIFNVHNVLSGQQVPDYDDEWNQIGSHFVPTAWVLPRFISASFIKKF